MTKHRLYRLRFRTQNRRPQTMWQPGDRPLHPVDSNLLIFSHPAPTLKTKQQVELSKSATQRKGIHKQPKRVNPDLIQLRNAALYKSLRRKHLRWVLLRTDSLQAKESRLVRVGSIIRRLIRLTTHTLLLLIHQVRTWMPASHPTWKESMMGSYPQPATRVDRTCRTRLSTTTSI